MAAKPKSIPISFVVHMFLAKNKWAQIGMINGMNLLKDVKRFSKWGITAAVFGAWLVFPAIPDSFREKVGLPLYSPPTSNPSSIKFQFDEPDTMPSKK